MGIEQETEGTVCISLRSVHGYASVIQT